MIDGNVKEFVDNLYYDSEMYLIFHGKKFHNFRPVRSLCLFTIGWQFQPVPFKFNLTLSI